MEIVILLVVAVGLLAIGIRVGMLLAPRVERMADRANRQEQEPGVGTDVDAPHEDDDDGTD